ncbi:hypothetical protein AWB70_06250 [Caballeronia cordobensis]|uniref:Uncharacterized protein n=1 Tax=Caballeronia cordobensis TaxID=1353886 RepID=A0A158JBE3_CABCO|nr:hypothetical protein AWB70_06250 [Caballeronia cordobensis]
MMLHDRLVGFCPGQNGTVDEVTKPTICDGETRMSLSLLYQISGLPSAASQCCIIRTWQFMTFTMHANDWQM